MSGNDGLNYLIVSNPMKIETIDVDMANTLDFSQIDTIAQDYINKHTFDETVYDITDIRYGLIRVSNEEDDSYQLLPAWYYLAEGSEENANPYLFPICLRQLSTPSTEASTITNLATSINIETNRLTGGRSYEETNCRHSHIHPCIIRPVRVWKRERYLIRG